MINQVVKKKLKILLIRALNLSVAQLIETFAIFVYRFTHLVEKAGYYGEV